MRRRSSSRAALALAAVAALAASTVAAAAPVGAAADPGGGQVDDPSARTEMRKSRSPDPVRTPATSRRAERAAAVRARDDSPLAITIDQLTPSVVPDQGVVRIAGTVTNNDTVAWQTVNLYAFISDQPMTTAAQLDAAAATPADALVGRRITDEKDLVATLAPGEEAVFNFRVPRRLLRQSVGLANGEPGVYWFGVHALGEGPEGRDDTADGRARTFLPYVPPPGGGTGSGGAGSGAASSRAASPAGSLPTSVVIPLRRQLVHADDGSVEDLAGWTQALAPGGRLRALVDFGAGSGDRAVTWVVDPALVDVVRRIAAGNPPRSMAPNLQSGEPDGEEDGPGDGSGDGSDDASDDASGDDSGEGPADGSGTPTPAPSATPVPSGEDGEADGTDSPLDLDGLDPVVQAAAEAAQAWLARFGEAMRPDDQVLTLPYGDVDVAGAAVHDPDAYRQAAARGAGLTGFDVATTRAVSSPSGYLSDDGLALVDPATTVLVTDAMFERGAPTVARTAGRDVVVSSSGAAAGGPGPDTRTGVTAMRQRLLAEAAVRSLRGGSTGLAVVLPHDWNPSDGTTFFAGLDLPWLDLTDVASLQRRSVPAAVDAATLRYPNWQAEAELDQAGFDAAAQLARSGSALQSMLTLNNRVAGTVADQALGTLSYSARSRPVANRVSADASRRWIEEQLGEVEVSAPRAVTLSSTNGRFQATVTNRLDQPVTVSITARSDGRLTVDGGERVEVAAGGRAAVLLTAQTEENGVHDVELVVADKRGVPLGSRTRLTIRSAQVSNIIWLILGAGAALLFGAIGVRLFRRFRDARRAPEEPPDHGAEGDAEGGAGAAPREPAEAGQR